MGGGEVIKVKISSKPLTRKQSEDRREYWRSAKMKYRSKLNPQKKRWIREKDRKRKQTNRMEKDKSNTSSCEGTPFSSKKTEWNVTAKARAGLPKEPELFAKVVNNLVNNSSPRKRKAVKRLDMSTPNYKELKSTKQGKSALRVFASKLLKKASARQVSKRTGLCRDSLGRINKRGLERKLRACRYNKATIENFFKREDISRVLPQKRFAMRIGPGYLLQVSLKAAYTQFKAENPNEIISFAKFASLRPKNVRLLKNTHREFCLCVYCTNVRYKVLVLSRLTHESDKKIINETDILRILLCPKSDGFRFHRSECVYGTCTNCSDYESTINKHFSYAFDTENVSWNRWEWVEMGRKRRILKSKTGHGRSLVEELVMDITHPCVGTNFIKHLFIAKWQTYQYTQVKQDLKKNWAISVMDFAKNRTIQYQDEIKAAFFGAKQVTLHPIVTHYRLNDNIIRDSLVFISSDITHDYHAVNHFFSLAEKHLAEKLGQMPEYHIIFSDGCSGQYKSRGPFADLSLMKQPINRNFFGSEHGKSEGDGETGIINRAIDRAVLGRQTIINDADDLYRWCQENLTMNEPLTQRHFFFVKAGEINRNRPYTNVKVIAGTRQFHQLKNVPGHPYEIKTRRLSCFCPSCLDKKNLPCVNETYVSKFVKKTVTLTVPDVSLQDSLNLSVSDSDVDKALQTLMDVEDLVGTLREDVMTLEGADVEIADVEIAEEIADVEIADVEIATNNLGQAGKTPGNHFLVQHGAKQYPAVVVDTPVGFGDLPENTFWAYYFLPGLGLHRDQWTMDETVHLITNDEVIKSLAPPNIVCHGRRFMYHFQDN